MKTKVSSSVFMTNLGLMVEAYTKKSKTWEKATWQGVFSFYSQDVPENEGRAPSLLGHSMFRSGW